MKPVKSLICLLLALCLLSAAALSEGILPVLQTPQPDLAEIISFHSVIGMEGPEPVQLEDGGLEYRYSPVGYAQYLDFGKALKQENYTLLSSETGEDGAAVAVVSKDDSAPVTIRYHEDFRELTVRYPLRTTARGYDPAEPFTVDQKADSLLPELILAISLHSATGRERVTPVRAENGATRYCYKDVAYSCYTAFSVKLGREGYSLVSSEMLPDGISRANVSDGKASLCIDYDPATLVMEITYPAGVYARDLNRYADYTEVAEEQPFELLDCASVTLRGWETADSCRLSTGEEIYPDEGKRFIRILADISYNSPETRESLYLFSNIEACSGGEDLAAPAFGRYDPATGLTDSGNSEISGRRDLSLSMLLSVTDEQAARPDQIVVTFTDPDRAVRYCYPLEKEDIPACDRIRARWGVGMAGALTALAAEKSGEGGELLPQYRALTRIDFLHPDHIIVVKLRPSQLKTAAEALGAENGADLAPALAKAINAQFSDAYARASWEATARTGGLSDELSGTFLLILPYGEHIVVISMDGKNAACSSVISTEDISAGFGAEDIRREADRLGVSKLYIREYKGEGAEELLGLSDPDDKWNSGTAACQYLINAAGNSDAAFAAVFPRLKGYPSVFYALIRGYLAKRTDYPGVILNSISDALHEPTEADANPVLSMLDTQGTLPSGDAVAENVPEWGTTMLTGETPDPEGTYVFMVTLHEPGEPVRTVYDWQLEAALPSRNIPADPEKADYIIHLDITYDDSPDLSQNGISLYYPNGRINLYRAADGAWIGEYGTVTHTLTGFMMMSRGSHYWKPYRKSVWNNVRSLFEQ